MTAIGVLHGGDRGTARSILFSRDTATASVMARFQCWLVKSGSHLILIDAGIPAGDPRVGAIIGARTTRDLFSEGVDASSVTDVVLTHLHWDHVGDIDAFENAVIHVQARELDFLGSAWFERPALRNLFAAQSKLDWILANPRLHPISTDALIAKGVTASWVGGHTPGSQIVLVALDRHRAVITGDAVNTLHNLAHDIPPGILWSMPDALDALARVRRLKDEGFAVIPSHEAVGLPGAGGVPPDKVAE